MKCNNMVMKTARNLAALTIAAMIMGAGMALIYTQTFAAKAECKILYVAQEEIIELEKERIKNDDLKNRQLFFGLAEKAASLAATLPKSYESANTRVVYSVG